VWQDNIKGDATNGQHEKRDFRGRKKPVESQFGNGSQDKHEEMSAEENKGRKSSTDGYSNSISARKTRQF
jgi:hypothetical protein